MNKIENPNFTVREFAALTHTTPETLRYYHRIGLLHPSYINPQNGYRYYSLLEFETLGVIQALQSLEMPLQTIQEYLNSKTVFRSYQLLSHQYEHISEKIETLLQTQKYLNEKLNSIHAILEQHTLADKIYEKQLPRRAGYASLTPCHTYAEYQIESAKLMERYNKNLFLSNSFALILREDDAHRPQFYSLIFDIEKPFQVPCEQYALPAGTYISLQFRGSFTESTAAYQNLLAYIEEKNLQIAGNPVLICIIDENYTNVEEEKITEIQIPVQQSAIS